MTVGETWAVNLDNPQWVKDNLWKLRALFPETWTHLANIKVLPLMFQMKLLGIDFRTDEEFASALASFEALKIIHRDGHLIRRCT